MCNTELIIGIVGGMGSYATVDFFRKVIEAFPAEKEWERPRIIVDNYCTMPSRVRAILYGEGREELVEDLSESVRNLMRVGANKIVLACNTSHVFLPDIIQNVPESKEHFVHIIDECGKSIQNSGIRSVGLIASEGTIETRIYPNTFEKYGISINAPDEQQFELLRQFIEAIKQNKLNDSVMDAFEKFIEDFEDEAVILGCTELPILYAACAQRGYQSTKKIFDPLQSAIDALVVANGK